MYLTNPGKAYWKCPNTEHFCKFLVGLYSRRTDRLFSNPRRMIEQFIENVKELSELITEFDESLWAGLVDSMTVHSKDRIVFRLTCGVEIGV